MARPEHSQEPAFQFTAALVHAFCAFFNASAAIYHLRRIQGDNKKGPR